MRKLLLILALLSPALLFAQTPARFDLPVLTTTPATTPPGNQPPLYAVINATVNVCGYPATMSGGVCTNKVTTYTDSTLSTPCPSTAQLTAPGSSACISTTGLQGALGFWYDASTQTHMTYTISTSWGNFGPYDIDQSGGGHIALSTNSTPNASQSALNFSDTPTVQWSNPSGGVEQASVLVSGGFQMFVPDPLGTQSAVVPFTVATNFQNGSGFGPVCTPVSTPTSGQITMTGGGSNLGCSAPPGPNVTWSSAVLPAYITPANVTAIYAVGTVGYTGTSQALSVVCEDTSSHTTTLMNGGSIGGSSPPVMASYNAPLTWATGTGIGNISCVANIAANAGGASQTVILNVPQIALLVYYTGTAPPVNDALNLTSPLYYNPALNSMGVSQINLAANGDGGVVGLLPNANLANPSMTINGTTCTLGSSCTPSGGGGTTTNALTAAATGGAAPGTTFNGSAAVTFDYHSVGAPGISGTPATGNCVDWASANTLGDAGSPCGSGGGSGTVTDGSGTTTANQIATSTTTSHQIQYGTALPNGTTATTQTTGDNSTKVATDAFVIANAGGGAGAYLPLGGGTVSNMLGLTGGALDISSANNAFNFQFSNLEGGNFSEGVAYDGTYIYGMAPTAFYKYNSSLTLVDSNTSPFAGITPTPDHMGDGETYSGKLYEPLEVYSSCGGGFSNQALAVYDTTTAGMPLITYNNISADAHEVSAVAVDGADSKLYVSSFCDGSKLWIYDMTTLTLESTLTLSNSIASIQGLSYDPANGLLYAFDNGLIVYSINPASGIVTPVYIHPTTGEGEGADFTHSTPYISTSLGLYPLTPIIIPFEAAVPDEIAFQADAPAGSGSGYIQRGRLIYDANQWTIAGNAFLTPGSTTQWNYDQGSSPAILFRENIASNQAEVDMCPASLSLPWALTSCKQFLFNGVGSFTLPGLTSDPGSPANGTVWWNSTSHLLNARLNGITVPLPSVVDTQVTLATATYAAAACTSASTVAMANLSTSMTLQWTPTSDISSITGWSPSGGLLYIQTWPSAANTMSYEVCNPTGLPITTSASTTWNVSAR